MTARSSQGVGKKNRVFVFLQGPHGPFFSQLGRQLTITGAEVWRVGFNAGDQLFWRDKAHYIAFRETLETWPEFFTQLVVSKKATDLVIYGDVRDIHAKAIEIANSLGMCVHVFEEGYIRPYWATYERNGSNGHSRLMDLGIPEMREALERSHLDTAPPPAHWGDMRHHIYYGAIYHGFLLLLNWRYRNFRPHRRLTVSQEFRLHLKRFLLSPLYVIERTIATKRVKNSSFPYHLALLQLEHDSAFQAHSDFETNRDFIRVVCEGFAEGAAGHHHLVFKAHPLEDGRTPIRRAIREISAEYGIKDRVHFIRGGKLARLLNDARTAVTVNSTAGQQVLWRAIPLRVFGETVYKKPEFVSDQPLAEFFSNPPRPDKLAYIDYRRFLMETSQLPGGYYSAKGRRQLLRRVVDMMLADKDPYDLFFNESASPGQHLQAIS